MTKKKPNKTPKPQTTQENPNVHTLIEKKKTLVLKNANHHLYFFKNH